MTRCEEHWRQVFLAAYQNNTGDARRLALNEAWFAFVSSDYYRTFLEGQLGSAYGAYAYWTALVDAAQGEPHLAQIASVGVGSSIDSSTPAIPTIDEPDRKYEPETKSVTLSEWMEIHRQDPSGALDLLSNPENKRALFVAACQLGKRGTMAREIIRKLAQKAGKNENDLR